MHHHPYCSCLGEKEKDMMQMSLKLLEQNYVLEESISAGCEGEAISMKNK